MVSTQVCVPGEGVPGEPHVVRFCAHATWHPVVVTPPTVVVKQTAAPLTPAGLAHLFLQPSQLSGSVLVSTQLPLQSVKDPQEPPHVLLMQTWSAPHVFPHAPQLFGSFVVSAHVVPHCVVLSSHDAWHWPSTQTVHATPASSGPPH